MTRLRAILAVLGAMLVMSMASAFAHQQKSAITTVLFNPRTGNIEVMHRFQMHDAEHAVKEIFGKEADILADTQTQQRFNDYVNKHFSMATGQGTALALTPVGFEIEGKFFWVYQETPVPEALESLVVTHNALREIWPAQINTVNVERGGEVKTLTFEEQTELLTIKF